MTKMKRIEQIAQGKNVANAQAALREKRVKRTLEAAIDAAEEASMEADAKAQKVLDTLGDKADSVASLTAAFNSYAQYLTESEDYLRTMTALERLRDLLDEDVEIEEKEK